MGASWAHKSTMYDTMKLKLHLVRTSLYTFIRTHFST